MALYDDPPHSVDTYTVVSGSESGGGVTLTFTLAQSGVKCSIDTASADEQERFARMQQVVTHRVGFRASVLTTALTPGMKLVAGDTGGSFHVKGIAKGREYGGVPPFVYAFCEELL
jgi:hypothetical protein